SGGIPVTVLLRLSGLFRAEPPDAPGVFQNGTGILAFHAGSPVGVLTGIGRRSDVDIYIPTAVKRKALGCMLVLGSQSVDDGLEIRFGYQFVFIQPIAEKGGVGWKVQVIITDIDAGSRVLAEILDQIGLSVSGCVPKGGDPASVFHVLNSHVDVAVFPYHQMPGLAQVIGYYQRPEI